MAEGHRNRLRSRLMNEPLESIPEYVVLEIMLTGVIQRKDTCGIARALIERFGCLAAVIDAPIEKLTEVDGVGEAAAYYLKSIPLFYRKYSLSKWKPNVVFNSLASIGEYLVDRCIGVTQEIVLLLCMDANLRMLCCEQISEGSVSSVDVNIRKILHTALRYNASRVVVAHTHPGGNAIPSFADIDSTEQIASALNMAGIFLDDHMVIAGDDYVSMRSSGMNREW